MNVRHFFDRTQAQRLMVAFVIILTFLVLVAQRSQAFASDGTVIEVNTYADSKQASDRQCSLREAIIAANEDKASGKPKGECPAGNGNDTIVLAPGVYVLSRSDSGKEDSSRTGDLDISGDVTIRGVPNAPRLTTEAPNLVVIDGGTINDRVFHILTGTVTLENLTIRNGDVIGSGGGIFSAGALTLRNSTLTANSATVSGGALFTQGRSELNYVTVRQNSAPRGSAVAVGGEPLAISHSILAGNLGPQCSGPLLPKGVNLVDDAASCGEATGIVIDPQRGADYLQASYLSAEDEAAGLAALFALRLSSEGENPAVDAVAVASCVPTDQRGRPRPDGSGCDIGAYEMESPIRIVNTTDDVDDGSCDINHCSLREALNGSNARDGLDSVLRFAIPTPDNEAPVIALDRALPAIVKAVIVEGASQPGGTVIVDGANAGSTAGIIVETGNVTIRGLTIRNFDGSGIELRGAAGNNTVTDNTITNNRGNGIIVLESVNNNLAGNRIFANAGQPIDLGGDGPTFNDARDPDTGANFKQNHPILVRAVPQASGLHIDGRLNSRPNQAYSIRFSYGATCGQEQTIIDPPLTVTTDETGDIYFQTVVAVAAPYGHQISATATDSAGNTSEYSSCLTIGPDNESWPRAQLLTPDPATGSIEFTQTLERPGQSRWYKVGITPQMSLDVLLSDLPADYDLTVYKDIGQAFQALFTASDEDALRRLGAEFAADAFSADAFSPDTFSPDTFSPDAYSPDTFSPDTFSPDTFSPDTFSPDTFSPDTFSPDTFSPDTFSPDTFSPDTFSPDTFSPDTFSPDTFSPEDFSSAQMQSLLAVSAYRGTVQEEISVNTWNNTGEFYIRVRGANGGFSPNRPFTLAVTRTGNGCAAVQPIAGSRTLLAANAIPEQADSLAVTTLLLTDLQRLKAADSTITAQSMEEMRAQYPELDRFITNVQGLPVDVGQDVRVAAANRQADQSAPVSNIECPYAKNLVAQEIHAIIKDYRAAFPNIEYIVILGNDDVIPFFRYPDNALLGNEQNYIPPVRDNTASQASLRLGYVLGQDAYGASLTVSLNNDQLPIPELPVGRLVETIADIKRVLAAYNSTFSDAASTPGVITPRAATVTGYDFLTDTAEKVSEEFSSGLGDGAAVQQLIAPRDCSPLDTCAWSADDLRAVLLTPQQPPDLVFLAGHFSANRALAADYRTRFDAAELARANLDLANAVVFSAGCHAGYNIVNEHGIPGVTREPDWPQAFAGQGATLIAGTGYQYGDTDFIEYSERLYLEFSRELRRGEGPVSIGKALVAAKRQYLADTPQLRPIHEKALLQTTIFGLPMLQIDMPGLRLAEDTEISIVGNVTAVDTNPGLTLGLTTADISLKPTFSESTITLTSIGATAADQTPPGEIGALYLRGRDGVVTNPAEPVLPLERYNVGVTSSVLRGVGFVGGAYTDQDEVIPLTGAATTELRGVHVPFVSTTFFPIRFWQPNYFDALSADDGPTWLNLLAAQFKSSPPDPRTGVLRRYDRMDFRLFYSNNTATYANDSQPALSAPPTITEVTSALDEGNPNRVHVNVRVVGNPAAGIQDVWITYTATSGSWYGAWQSLTLTQDANDSSLWTGMLDVTEYAAANPSRIDDIRFVVQAVNGVGLVSASFNIGDYHRIGQALDAAPTALEFRPAATGGAYGSSVDVEACLVSDGDVFGSVISFSLGPQARQGVVDDSGCTRVSLPLLALPGSYQLSASFGGSVSLLPAQASTAFEITKQYTQLQIDPVPDQPVRAGVDAGFVIRLADVTGRSLGEKTVFTVITNEDQSIGASQALITNFLGEAPLGAIDLPAGTYTLVVNFGGAPDGRITLFNTGEEAETITVSDVRYSPTKLTIPNLVITENSPPVCEAAVGSPDTLWPLNQRLQDVKIEEITDPDEDAITIRIDAIYQDEPVDLENKGPDGGGIGGAIAQLRAERDGNGDGRVYHVYFTAYDDHGGQCRGLLRIPTVPHDQSGSGAIDGGDCYNSVTGEVNPAPLSCPAVAGQRTLLSAAGRETTGSRIFLPAVRR